MSSTRARWVGIALIILVVAVTAVRPRYALPVVFKNDAVHILTHVIVFGTLAAVFATAFPGTRARWAVFVAIGLLGFATEAYEHLYNTWPIEMDDVLTDIVAAALGVLASAFLEQWRDRRDALSE